MRTLSNSDILNVQIEAFEITEYVDTWPVTGYLLKNDMMEFYVVLSAGYETLGALYYNRMTWNELKDKAMNMIKDNIEKSAE